ncbi:hypothetical protein ATPR_1633 [Acetobacter tropicalis NBRC 101654]|uniref:Uncharacterized protein n=1 Tax=Acetobacter tropicalis NBRC 101654 TaxID=749388 RepID=F7VE34_9PROT|nr:hypothetical protein ATPR_1633 [Acetobacter tropicalis NBRC 101654]
MPEWLLQKELVFFHEAVRFDPARPVLNEKRPLRELSGRFMSTEYAYACWGTLPDSG